MNTSGGRVNGFINLYKPNGPTSMDMVREIKRITGQRKRVGHGGTLDPLAEGVLPICFSQATRLMEHLVDSPRQYRMIVHLGVTTATYDGEGEVVQSGDPSGLSRSRVEEAVASFQGVIYQTPPMYSAIKVDGKRLYQLARSGIVVEREPRKVNIPRVELLEFDSPILVLEVDSGRGAYMRSLAHDLGQALGCGAYLKGLVRTRAGPFKAADAVSMTDLRELQEDEGWRSKVLPVDYAVLDMKGVSLTVAAERFIRSGQTVSLGAHEGLEAGYLEKFRAYTSDGRFLAVLSFDRAQSQWRPHKVFNLDEQSPYAPSASSN